MPVVASPAVELIPRIEMLSVLVSKVTPGVNFTRSAKFLMFSWSIRSVVKALTLAGTRSMSSARRVAVTTTCSIPPPEGAVCASAEGPPPNTKAANERAERLIQAGFFAIPSPPWRTAKPCWDGENGPSTRPFGSDGQKLANRAMGLIDGRIGVGARAGVRIGDGDAAEALAADHIRPLVRRNAEIVEERIELVGIAMRPAIYRDRRDVACRIESGSREHARELVADIPLERLERRLQKLIAARAVLILFRQPGLAGRTHHEGQDRVIRRTHAPVIADVHRPVEPNAAEIAPGSGNARDAKLVERAPVLQRHAGIDQRDFHQLMQRRLLFG